MVYRYNFLNVSVGLVVCMASKVSSALRRVLVLGSGFTSAPLVECLTRDGGIAVTVGMIYTIMYSSSNSSVIIINAL